MKSVLLVGEGTNELGGWGAEPTHRDPARRGVLVALLQKRVPSGWKVVDALRWKDLPKFRVGGHRGAEERAVLGLIERAKGRVDVVAFVRDRDGDTDRHAQIEAALQGYADEIAGAPAVAGAVAIERLESWVLAVIGERGTEGMSTPKVDAALEGAGVDAKSTDAMVAAVDAADLSRLPDDAVSLSSWLERAAAPRTRSLIERGRLPARSRRAASSGRRHRRPVAPLGPRRRGGQNPRRRPVRVAARDPSPNRHPRPRIVARA